MIKENSKVEVIVEDVVSPLTSIEIENVVKKKYGENTIVKVKGRKYRDANLIIKTNNVKSNDLRLLYESYVQKKFPEIDFEQFMELDGEISKQLIKSEQGEKFTLKWINAKNILSFGEVKIHLDNQGIVRIHSDPHNMGGKSNLTRLIKILLFGEFYRNGNRTTLDSLLHRFSPLNYGTIEGEIEIKNKIYNVKRDFQKNKTKVSQKVTITCEGEIVDQSTFDELIGTIKNFLFTSYFDSYSVEKWLNTKPTERYRLFIQYFGLSVLEEKQKIHKVFYDGWLKSSKVNQYKNQNLESEVQKFKSEIQSNENQNLILDAELKDLEKQKTNISQEIKKLLNQQHGVPDSLANESHETLLNKHNQLILDIAKKTADIQNIKIVQIEESKQNLESRILEIQNKISSVSPSTKQSEDLNTLEYMKSNYTLPLGLKEKKEKSESKISDLRTEYTRLSTEKKIKTELLENTPDIYVCQNCKTETNNEEKKRFIQQEINLFESELEKVKQQGQDEKINLTLIQEEISANKIEYSANISTKIYTLNQEIEKHKKDIIWSLNKEISILQNEIQQYTNNEHGQNTIALYKQSLLYMQKEQAEINKKINLLNSYTDIVKHNLELDGEILRLENEKSDLERKISDFAVQLKLNIRHNTELQNNINQYQNIITEYNAELQQDILHKVYQDIHSKGGLSMEILNDFITEINTELSTLIEDDFSPSIQIQDDAIEFIFHRNGIEFNLIEGSGYEKTMTSLCLHYILLHKMDIPLGNIFILDEVFVSVNRINLSKIYNVVQKILNIYDTILLITQYDEISEWADKSILITKQNNNSKLI